MNKEDIFGLGRAYLGVILIALDSTINNWAVTNAIIGFLK